MKAELKPYPELAPSGVPWLGILPSHWQVRQLGFISNRVAVGLVINPSTYVADEGVPFLLGGDIREFQIETENCNRCLASVSDGVLRNTRLNAGDLVVVRVGYPGVAAVVPPSLEGSNCASMMIVRRHPRFDSQWLAYVFNSQIGRDQVGIVQYGAAQKQFNISHAVKFRFPFPPLPEQRSISAFLDRETAKIDRLMEVRRKQVERLQEQRTAIIHHAVTKGLDPKAKMKPSSIEWLGDVNCEWCECDIKHVAEVIAGGTPKSSEYGYWDGDVVWLTPTDLGKDNARKIDVSARTITSMGKAAAGLTLLPSGSLVMSTRAPVGSMGILAVPATTNQGCKGMAFDRDKADGRFFFYLLSLAVPYLNAAAQGATFVELSGYQLKNLPIACPDVAIQREIANWLDEEMNSFDTLADKYSREVDLLAEYRASLISHAVTGKIDVRGLVPPVTETSP